VSGLDFYDSTTSLRLVLSVILASPLRADRFLPRDRDKVRNRIVTSSWGDHYAF